MSTSGNVETGKTRSKLTFFRNTKNFYLEASNYASKKLIDFAVQHAENKILDIGCATGEYCQELNKLGFRCVGIDINPEYISKAIENGVEAQVMDAKCLKFPDKSFDTILLFEVLEHINNPIEVLDEAKRVSTKYVLITVPNCTEFNKLVKLGLTYEHMLDMDHINFFTKKTLEDLLSRSFQNFKVEERESIPIGVVGLPWLLYYPILALTFLKVIRSNIFFRLYAIAEIDAPVRA